MVNTLKEPKKSHNEKKKDSRYKKGTLEFSIKDIESILKMLSDNDVTEFELKKGGEKLSLKREGKVVQREEPSIKPSYTYMHPSSGFMAPHIRVEEPLPASLVGVPPTVIKEKEEVKEEESKEDKENKPEAIEEEEPKKDYHVIKSPIVGTFYRKPAVDADPYVEVGDMVKKGDILCIVEAMKIMNEIDSDVSGRILEICLDDGQMVEYGEVMFKIEK